MPASYAMVASDSSRQIQHIYIKLLFNESKSAHIHFGKEFGSHIYVLNGSTADNIRKLSVSRIWEYMTHCEKIIACAYKTLGLLQQNFTTPCPSAISTKAGYYNLLERQNVFKEEQKYILNDYTSSYKFRLIQLNLLPLMYQYYLLFFIKSYRTPSASYFNNREFVQFSSSSSTRSSSASKLVHQISFTTEH